MVVVGSGPNGLVAANMLAEAGVEVIVLEAADRPGGAVRSAPLAAPGFITDLCSAFYPLAGEPAPLAALRLEEHGLRWRQAPNVLTHITPDGRSATLNLDPTRTAASVEGWAAGDGRRWHAAYSNWLRTGPPFLRALFTPFPPVRPTAGLLRATGLGDSLRLLRRFLLPARQLGEELFGGDGARLLLAGCAMHADLTPGTALSGGYGWLLAMLAQQRGFPVPEGGAGALTDALVRRLRAHGGDIVCGAQVDEIRVRFGAARGVSCADGRRWGVRHAVIADVAAPTLYLDLLQRGAVPPRLLDDIRGFRFDSSTVKADWALSQPVAWNVPEAAGSGTVHLGTDLTGLTRYAAALDDGAVAEDPFVICGQMTTCDPARSPEGTESLWAYSHLPHRRDWSQADVDRVVDRMQAQLEQHAPGFGSTILSRQVLGPAGMHAENANLVGGALAGGTAAIHQQLIFRPVPGLGRADTPIDGLFLASASAHPGGGVHGGPGANAARAALARRAPLTGRLYAAAMRRLHRGLYRPQSTKS